MSQELPNLRTVPELAKETPWLPPASLRDLIHHAEPRVNARGETIPANGFADCIIRINGRVLIDRDKFITWVEKGRGAPAYERRRVAA